LASVAIRTGQAGAMESRIIVGAAARRIGAPRAEQIAGLAGVADAAGIQTGAGWDWHQFVGRTVGWAHVTASTITIIFSDSDITTDARPVIGRTSNRRPRRKTDGQAESKD